MASASGPRAPRPHIRGAAVGRRHKSARKVSLAGVASLFGAASLARRRAERRAKVAAARRAIRSAIKKAKKAARAQVQAVKKAAHQASVARRRAVRKAAAAERKARRVSAHKKSVAARRAARKAAREHARKAKAAGRAVVKAARKGLKRYSAMHKSGVKAVGSKSEVYKGLARHTSGGLTKSQIVRKTLRRGGKVVHRYMSKKKVAAGQKLMRSGKAGRALRAWRQALREVGVVGKAPKKGTTLYRKAKSIYARIVARPATAPVQRRRRVSRRRAVRSA
jgi:hypothetical protein